MKIDPYLQYVEQMRNIGYLTGFVRHLGKISQDTCHKRQLPDDFNGYLLQQTNNIEQAIPIHVPNGVPIPADKSPLTVAVHLFGHTDPITGQQTIRVKSLDHSRPSVRAMPPSMTWGLNSNKKYSKDEFNPFGKGSTLLDDFNDSVEDNGDEFTDAEAALQKMLEESKGKLDTRLGQNSNVIFFAGILDSFEKFMPDEHRNNSYWEIKLRQHREPSKNVPVRIYTKDMKGMGSKLKRGLPVTVSGQVRVKVKPNDDKDGAIENTIFINTDDVFGANRVTDIKRIPSWYSEMQQEHARMLQRQKEVMQKAQAENPDAKSEAEALMNKLTGE